MTEAISRQLAQAKAAIMRANPADALVHIEKMVAVLEQDGLPREQHKDLEAQLAELRGLADAALSGVKQAFDLVQTVIQTAQSLQTYDSSGKRQISPVTDRKAKRF